MTTIRPLGEADIPRAGSILRAAHRNESNFERLLWIHRALSPEFWWILEEDGRAGGVVGATDYGSFAHIGLMAIDPGLQAGGTGSLLLRHALAALEGAGFRSITLYSTDAGLGFYPRHGFQWQGLSTEWQLRKRVLHAPGHAVSPSGDLARIAAWDASIFAGRRLPLLRALEAENPGRILIAEDSQGELTGFLVAQPAVLGPIAAATPQAAADLIARGLDLPFEQAPRVLLPEAHAEAETVMTALGFIPVRTSRYFVRGEIPAQQRQLLYGQASYSLG